MKTELLKEKTVVNPFMDINADNIKDIKVSDIFALRKLKKFSIDNLNKLVKIEKDIYYFNNDDTYDARILSEYAKKIIDTEIVKNYNANYNFAIEYTKKLNENIKIFNSSFEYNGKKIEDFEKLKPSKITSVSFGFNNGKMVTDKKTYETLIAKPIRVSKETVEIGKKLEQFSLEQIDLIVAMLQKQNA